MKGKKDFFTPLNIVLSASHLTPNRYLYNAISHERNERR